MLATDTLPMEKPDTAASAEMPLMMLSLGIEPALLKLDHPALYSSMESVCAGCGSKEDCRKDLAEEAAASQYTRYCGNAATLSLMTDRLDLQDV